MSKADPVARRWSSDTPLPPDIYRSPVLDHISTAYGFGLEHIRIWRYEPLDVTIVHAHRGCMFAEIVVDYSDAHDWRHDALSRLRRALGTHDSTGRERS